jgi:hypothetical protein
MAFFDHHAGVRKEQIGFLILEKLNSKFFEQRADQEV